ncbi:MAG TPA: hypothetical protein PK801_01995 [Aggregatilineales bacterium]|nr:hypothetical protein [Aggregatilineales bacterium]HQA67064.1 hypothetical protein [Aggregatilineales bacterium]
MSDIGHFTFPENTSHESFGMPHMYVLVISKELSFRRLVVANLVIRGYLAVGVANVEEARRLVENVKPKLVVLSKAGRVSDGEMRLLREVEMLAMVPLIVISAETPDAEMMRRWDIDDHLLPLDVQDMVEKMSVWLTA